MVYVRNMQYMMGAWVRYGTAHLLQKAWWRHTVQQMGQSGTGIQVKLPVYVRYPKLLLLGNNVRIGKGTTIDAYGGVAIGDGTHIGNGVHIQSATPASDTCKTLLSLPTPRMVAIGKDVTIGNGVRILAGTIVPSGVSIPDGAVISPNNFELTTPPKDIHKQICWVVGTGRCGTQTIADVLDMHPEVCARHEPKVGLVPLLWQYAAGEVSILQLTNYIHILYSCLSLGGVGAGCYVESDHRLAGIVDLLGEYFPKSRFVWLVRHPRQVVSSTYGRGWFSVVEDRHRRCVGNVVRENIWSYYRPDPVRWGVLPKEVWQSMTAFEKNCWFYAYWNDMIDAHVSSMPLRGRFMRLGIEELGEQMDTLQAFLGVSGYPLPIQRSNQSPQNGAYASWTQQDQEAFERWIPCEKYGYGQ
jgi:serine acetyltransferase